MRAAILGGTYGAPPAWTCPRPPREDRPRMSTTWIRVAYAILLGVVLAVTAGFGVLIFETGPKPPQPAGVSFAQLTGQTTDQENSRIAKQIDSFFNDNQ